jgi:hypothetical protein
VVSTGPRAGLASFTAAEAHGLQGWLRPEIHVVAPPGVGRPRLPGVAVVRHLSTRADGRDIQPLAPALVLAASSFVSARSACGLLAAGVQQRLTTPDALRAALAASPRSRHRAVLLAAVADIALGAEALSEIDFVRLCRAARLPPPEQQAVRVEASGQRRCLDAKWRLRDGRIVVAEVDGAMHLAPQRWFDDQVRQNEITLGGAVVLRFPSALVRAEPALVVAQLRRALRGS